MSGYDVDVLVLDGDGDPVSGTEVTIYLHEGNALADLWKGGTLDAYTDDNGHAEFETATDHRYITIRCRGQEFGPYDLDDGYGFTINLD